MVERFIAKTDTSYKLEVSQTEIKELEAKGFLKVDFLIEYNDKGDHYYELAHLWTNDFRRGETRKEFCKREAEEFNQWTRWMLA